MATNPCPCGYSGEPRCTCTIDRVNRYQNRISGPLLDRIDLHIRLNRSQQKIISPNKSKTDSSDTVRQRVLKARKMQLERQQYLNSALTSVAIQEYLNTDSGLLETAQTALEKMDLSMRALHRAFKVAVTIADLEDKIVNQTHLMEALSYRLIHST